jgi:hypothetical protein
MRQGTPEQSLETGLLLMEYQQHKSPCSCTFMFSCFRNGNPRRISPMASKGNSLTGCANNLPSKQFAFSVQRKQSAFWKSPILMKNCNCSAAHHFFYKFYSSQTNTYTHPHTEICHSCNFIFAFQLSLRIY